MRILVPAILCILLLQTAGACTAHAQDPGRKDVALFRGNTPEALRHLAEVPSDTFQFVVWADPQGNFDAFRETIDEVNDMDPSPLFAVDLGDLGGHGYSLADYAALAGKVKLPTVIVHGNHDSRSPYDEFIRDVAQPLMGADRAHFSFDVGYWHFAVIPANIPADDPLGIIPWLADDLAESKGRPTMLLVHLPLMPVGLTQLEFYTFPMPLKQRIVELVQAHEDVRYVFNGHVHTGIKSSIKSSWTHKGTNYINAPTGTVPRGFGEEYPAFETGLKKGGYYLVVDVEGEVVTVTGRLAGLQDSHVYPDTFMAFSEERAPRWFNPVPDHEPNTTLINGDFEQDLEGWLRPFRYLSDDDPAYAVETVGASAGERRLRLSTKSTSRAWMRDEVTEVYQLVSVQEGKTPVVEVSYDVEQFDVSAGGYVRVMGFEENRFVFHMMFDWGKNRESCHHLPRLFYLTATGEQAGKTILQEMGLERRAMFWNLPSETGRWYDAVLDVRSLYDGAQGEAGAFDALGIDKLFIGLGTWAARDRGSVSVAQFDNVSVSLRESGDASKIRGVDRVFETGPEVFDTQLGPTP